MSSIELRNISVEFQIFDHQLRAERSLNHETRVGARINLKNKKITVRALSNVSISISEGERVALIGPNGSGKTTLLQVISGIYVPQTGEVCVCGEVSPMFNTMLGLNAIATGMENMLDRAKLFDIPEEVVVEKLPELCAMTNLGEYLSLPVRCYSSGMRARLAFVMCLMMQPEIFLVDEWIGFVDHAFSELTERKMQEIAENTGIMVLSSHNETIIERLCTRGILLRQGEVEFDGDALEALRIYYKSSGWAQTS